MKTDLSIEQIDHYQSQGFLIIDDFLASGQTIRALVRLVRHASAELVGIGALIEKAFEGGRQELEDLGVPLHALAVIKEMSDSKIIFEE